MSQSEIAPWYLDVVHDMTLLLVVTIAFSSTSWKRSPTHHLYFYPKLLHLPTLMIPSSGLSRNLHLSGQWPVHQQAFDPVTGPFSNWLSTFERVFFEIKCCLYWVSRSTKIYRVLVFSSQVPRPIQPTQLSSRGTWLGLFRLPAIAHLLRLSFHTPCLLFPASYCRLCPFLSFHIADRWDKSQPE